MARRRLIRGGSALLLAVLFVGAIVWAESRALPGPAPRFGPGDRGGPAERVVLVVEDRVSFEELLSSPAFARLAQAGGVGLMTTHVRSVDPTEVLVEGGPGLLDYLTIEWGTEDVPVGGGAPPLSEALNDAGIEVCSFFDPSTVGQRGGPTGLFALPGDDGPIERCPDGSMPGRRLIVVDDGRTMAADEGPDRSAAASALGAEADAVMRAVADAGRGGPHQVAVLVVVPSPSTDMLRRGDEVTPLILAQGSGDQLFTWPGRASALASDTTRRTGLVANVDVAPTILRLFALRVPSTMDGTMAHTVHGSPPYRLHRLHLEQRRIRLPIQLGEVAFVSALGIVAIAALVWLAVRGSLPPRFAAALRYLALCGAALEIPLMAGGLLPHLTLAWALPFLVLTTLALAAAARVVRWRGRMGPFVFLGWVGLAFVVVDAVFGWRGAAVPLLGGTMFDGVRFYGLPNSFIALLLGSAAFAAFGQGPFTGFLMLAAAGLFAGFPSLGANIGASIALFAAAGLWWVLRTERRVGIREVALVAGVVVGGVAVVLLVNRFGPGAPTHVTRFVERSESGLRVAFDSIRHRLGIGAGQVREAPAALIPLIGLPVVLGLVLARPGPIGRGLALAGKGWPDVLVVLTVAGMVAYVANDTGLAAAAPVFLYAMAGMAHPAFSLPRGGNP